MRAKTNAERQQTYWERKQQAGYRRLVLWVPADDLDAIKLMARSKHAIAQANREIRKQIEQDLRKELGKELKDQFRAELVRTTRQALLTQARAQARRQEAGANAPPTRVKFRPKSSALIRAQLRTEGWLYDPVAGVWILPTAPSQWERVPQLLDQISRHVRVLRLAADPDDITHSKIVAVTDRTKRKIVTRR